MALRKPRAAAGAGDGDPPAEPTGEAEPGSGDPGGGDDESRPVTKGDVVEIVKEVVKDLLPTSGGEGGGEEPAGEGGEGKSPPRRLADVEADAEQIVRNAWAKVRKEEETDQRLSKVEEKVSEKPPVKVKRSTRFLWGAPE